MCIRSLDLKEINSASYQRDKGGFVGVLKDYFFGLVIASCSAVTLSIEKSLMLSARELDLWGRCEGIGRMSENFERESREAIVRHISDRESVEEVLFGFRPLPAMPARPWREVMAEEVIEEEEEEEEDVSRETMEEVICEGGKSRQVVEEVSYEGGDGKVECSICLEEFVVGLRVTQLPCSHSFHGECVFKWLEKNNDCPLCRYMLPA